MPTHAQAAIFRSNVNIYVSWAFILTFTLACLLVLWHTAYGNNPVADMLVSTAVLSQ